MKRRPPFSRYVIGILTVIFVGLGLAIYALEQRQSYEVAPPADTSAADQGEPLTISVGPVSPITGESCNRAGERLIAVMLAGDAITRPLSGIGQADLVIEVPVITNGITRYLAFYGCKRPTEIGSVRSARDDFIPLALGFDAVFAHWGGSHFALAELKQGVIDNINALTNPYQAYFRKAGIAEPHNGFTSSERLRTAAEKFGYRLTSEIEPYPHRPAQPKADAVAAALKVPYPGQFRVEWRYDPAANTYSRFKGGLPEMDKNTDTQVMARVIVVLKTDIKQIEGQYNDVAVEGTGSGIVYQDGTIAQVTWRKLAAQDRVSFFDADGREVAFTPGKVWFQYVSKAANVTYEATADNSSP